ncbi:hypothetical protein C8J57DRAFT_1599944 [Mycena rebaudengoi]|nr:hypothetical protein C8J57DRAFT_1599944 [Mycena rebaudengoi]
MGPGPIYGAWRPRTVRLVPSGGRLEVVGQVMVEERVGVVEEGEGEEKDPEGVKGMQTAEVEEVVEDAGNKVVRVEGVEETGAWRVGGENSRACRRGLLGIRPTHHILVFTAAGDLYSPSISLSAPRLTPVLASIPLRLGSVGRSLTSAPYAAKTDAHDVERQEPDDPKCCAGAILPGEALSPFGGVTCCRVFAPVDHPHRRLARGHGDSHSASDAMASRCERAAYSPARVATVRAATSVAVALVLPPSHGAPAFAFSLISLISFQSPSPLPHADLLPADPSLPAFPAPTARAHAVHARLLSWFLDSPAAPFGMALAQGKDGGMWFGPSAAAGAVSVITSISLFHLFTIAFTFRSLLICLSSPTLRVLLFCSSSIPRANTFPQNACRRLPRLRHSRPVVPACAASPPMTEDELVLNAQRAEDAGEEDDTAERAQPDHAARAATRGSEWTCSGGLC